jgi:hypothetical protein
MLNSPAISRQHAKLQFEDDCWQIIDLGSANGTFLGDEAIQPNLALMWRSGFPLRLGPFTIQQHKAHETGKTPTLFLQPLNEISRDISRFVATLDSETVMMHPTQRKTAQLTIKNHSDVVVRLTLSLRNLPADWYDIPNDELLLHPNTRKQTLIRFALPDAAERGIHPFEIDVQDAGEKSEKVTVYGLLDITEQLFHAFSADLTYRNNSRLYLNLANSGNVDDSYKITLQPNPICSVMGHQWSSILKVEQHDSIQYSVKLKRPLLGVTTEHPIAMTVRSNSGIERQAQTTIPIQPIVPLWAVGSMMGLLLLLGILGTAFGWF